MKSLKLTILFVIIAQVVSAQIVFNKIIEDTISHITSSVITVDTGYVLLTGSRNEFMVRAFAISYIDINGNKQWKKTYTDSENELWEGYDNLKCDNGFPYAAGSHYNSITGERSVFIQKFNNLFEQDQQVFLYNDMTWKHSYDQIFTDNYFYVIGQIYDESDSNYKLLLAKADQFGEQIWLKKIGTLYESGWHIVKNYNGDLLIGGKTGSFSLPLHTEKWYVIKTDTSGILLWEKAFGVDALNNGAIRCLIETQDLNILTCGSYPVAGYGSGGEEIIWDGCLRKIDQNGELIWEKTLRSYLLSHTNDIYIYNLIYSILEKDGAIYALGWNYGYVSWKDRGYLAKMDKDGNLLWKREYYALDTNSYSQQLVSFKPTNDNGFVLAGYGNNYDSHGYNPPQQAWLVKTDSLGMDGLSNIEPDELNIDIDIQQIPESICMNDTIDVYVYISGKSAPYTIEFSTGQVIDSIYYPACFVPVEIGLTDINLEWGGETYFEETITEATLSNHEWGQCIAKPIEFYTPSTWGPQDLHITITDAYGETKTITKEIFAVECSTYNKLPISSNVKIYPNPVIDKLDVEIPKGYNFNYAEIHSSNGQLVLTHDLITGVNTIDVRNLLSGTYVIKLSDTNGNTESKVFEKIE